jgi:heavy metal efflux system protein
VGARDARAKRRTHRQCGPGQSSSHPPLLLAGSHPVLEPVGRPDDGTDHTSFFNTEYFVDLKPREQWRPAFHQKKDELIASMSGELSKIPGVIWGFSQPIEDNMEEAVSGVKGQLATKVYGDDLHVLESLADQIAGVLSGVRGITDLGVLQVTGQPNYDFAVDRAAAARYQINVADVQNAVNTAVGGNAP